MKDYARELARLGPRVLTVLMDVSNKCNIRCRMCHFSYDSVFRRRAVYLPPARFREIADQLFPLAHTVYLSAANEPMVSPHFGELVGIAGRYDIPDLRFLTNGLLMGPEIVNAVLDSGVDQIHVSIDGARRQTYEHIRRGGKFWRLIANLEHLRDEKARRGLSRPLVQFNITLMRSNIEELPTFVDLAEELGVTRIAARHLVLYERLGMESERLSLCPELANEQLLSTLERASISDSVTITDFPDLFCGNRARPRDTEATIREIAPSPPIGSLDQPRARELAGSNSILFDGWALDASGEVDVTIERSWIEGKDVTGNDSRGRVRIGQAKFRIGTRPDVATAHPQYVNRFRSAWSFELNRESFPFPEPFTTDIYVVATNPGGETTTLGVRRLRYSRDEVSAPFRYCTKPFDSLYVDAAGVVSPYPDCLGFESPGNLLHGHSVESIWYGRALTELRNRILERDPPPMCLGCPKFINRNVDDSNYFDSKEVEHLPQGRAVASPGR